MVKRRASEYKQMAFETAIRNPERYLKILQIVNEFKGLVLNDSNLLKIVSTLYLVGEVSGKDLIIDENSTIDSIQDKVIELNKTRNGDGGFPKGYQARFWTYMRTLSELGFVYARYNEKFEISPIGKKLINEELSEQEAFSIQSMKYNRRSPHRNVTNDFNFFRFILEILFEFRKQKKTLTYERFIIAMFSKNGNVKEYINLVDSLKLKGNESVYEYLTKNNLTTNKIGTICQDYPDVVRRLFIISGFISIKYDGVKNIILNEMKLEYIKDLLSINFKLSDEAKEDAKIYFKEMNSRDDDFIKIAMKHRDKDIVSSDEYTNRIKTLIKEHNLSEEIIIECLNNINKNKKIIPEFSEIPAPTQLEFYITLLVALKYGGKMNVLPNYKYDHLGKPYGHAPGNMGDIEITSNDIYWLIEVTLIRNKVQQYNHETTSIVRHLVESPRFKTTENKYLSFIAPHVHSDTKEFLDFEIVKLKGEGNVSIKPYTIESFTETLQGNNIFADMEDYSKGVIEEFKSKLL